LTLDSSSTIEVRPYHRADLNGVNAVLTATYGKDAPPASFFERWACDCPTAQSGFFVATSADRIVGLQPMHVARFARGQTEYLGAILAGVAVHPDFRRKGIFSALIAACEGEAWKQRANFVLTMPNEKSLPGFGKLKYQNLGRRTLYLKPNFKFIAPSRTRAALSRSGQTIETQVFTEMSELNNFLESCCSVRRVEFSAMEDACGLRNDLLGLKRSPEWYRWRYSQNLMHSYRGCAIYISERLVGLAIFGDERRRGLRITYLMDLVISPQLHPTDYFRSIIPAALQVGSTVLATITSSSDLGKVLASNRFLPIPHWFPLKQFHTVVKFNPQSEYTFTREFSDIRSWYFTPGDWDTL
jgi:GNAT superfamily N-acetyltransferase